MVPGDRRTRGDPRILTLVKQSDAAPSGAVVMRSAVTSPCKFKRRGVLTMVFEGRNRHRFQGLARLVISSGYDRKNAVKWVTYRWLYTIGQECP